MSVFLLALDFVNLAGSDRNSRRGSGIKCTVRSLELRWRLELRRRLELDRFANVFGNSSRAGAVGVLGPFLLGLGQKHHWTWSWSHDS